MLFDIDGDGEDGDRARWVRASREVLADVVHRPEDLRALCDTGFPQRPFWMAPALTADGCAVEGGGPVVDLGDEVVIIEEEFGAILLFGAVQRDLARDPGRSRREESHPVVATRSVAASSGRGAPGRGCPAEPENAGVERLVAGSLEGGTGLRKSPTCPVGFVRSSV
ncbi:hypothetical protein [Streptomyces sp. NBC_00236]|uniref:hypothetical protein n=1 Tax=Streptomyces sp. NBC_00236 TaxID=2903639 RepID=UPI002E2D87B5|nr:hypothetical protein [Streptomyces sp. NBC_00236]